MNKVKGIIYACISAITYGLSPILIAISYSMGNNFLMMVFSRNFLILPIAFLYLMVKKISIRISKEDFISLCLVTCLGLSASLIVLYMSYNYIPVGLATSIHFIYPSIVAVLSVLVFKEEMSKVRRLAILSSLVGVLLFIDLKGGSSNLYLGLGLAFLSGLSYAYYIVFLAKSGVLRLDSMVVVFYTCLISTFFVGLITLFTGNMAFSKISSKGWLLIFSISIMVTFLGTLFTQLAVKNIGTTMTSVMSTLEPIATIVVGVVMYNEKVGTTKLIACFFIVLAVFLLALDQKQMAKKRAENIEKYEDIIS